MSTAQSSTNSASQSNTASEGLVGVLVELNKLCNTDNWTVMTWALNNWPQGTRLTHVKTERREIRDSWSNVKKWALHGNATFTVAHIETIRSNVQSVLLLKEMGKEQRQVFVREFLTLLSTA